MSTCYIMNFKSQEEADLLSNNALKNAWYEFSESQEFNKHSNEISKEFVAIIKFTFKSGFDAGVRFVANCVDNIYSPNHHDSMIENAWLSYASTQGIDTSNNQNAIPTIKFTFNTSFMYGVIFVTNTIYPK